MHALLNFWKVEGNLHPLADHKLSTKIKNRDGKDHINMSKEVKYSQFC